MYLKTIHRKLYLLSKFHIEHSDYTITMALGWRSQYNRYKDFFLNVSTMYKQRADLRAFLEIILSLSTVVIFLIFALKPTALTIISLLKEIEGKKQTITSLDKKIRDLNTANDVFSQHQNSITAIETAVANQPQPDAILQQIERLAARNSVNVLGATVGQVTLVGTTTVKKTSSDLKPLPGSANSMPISMNISGPYANLLQFLKDFENLRIVTKIDSLTVNSSKTDSGQVIVAIVSGRVPFLQEPNAKN